MIEQLMNEYGYMESGTDDLLMPHVLTDTNSVGYGVGVTSLTEGSWPFDQPSEPNGPTPMATIDSQTYYGGSSDTGFELLDFIIPDGGDYHTPVFMQGEPGTYILGCYGLLHDGYNLPNFTKLSVDNTEYDIYPMPDQEPPSTTGCYVVELYQELIDSQEMVDEYKAITGADVKIGDTLLSWEFVLLTEQVLSGDVPFTLYAGQDSWSGTLHEYVDTSANVYGALAVNSDSTAYELTVYTDNCSNPYVKIGEDGEWQAYDENNKPSIYLPGDTYIYLKATSDADGREVTGGSEYRITYGPGDTYQPLVIENPSNMFAGATLHINSSASYTTGSLTGRDDVVLQYKVFPSDEWLTAQLTNTSAGYFAELNLGWGQKNVALRITVSGELAFESSMGTLDLKPMSPSFVDIINDQGTYYARLRFGANYPDMNTVETIEYSFDDENWVDAVHDATSGYELAEDLEVTSGENILYFRTKLVSDSSIKSASQITRYYSEAIGAGVSTDLEWHPIEHYTARINKIQYVIGDWNSTHATIIKGCPFRLEVTPEAGYVFKKSILYIETGNGQVQLDSSTNNPHDYPYPVNNPYGNALFISVDVELQQQSPSADNN